jgi:hypothetical protein
MDYLAQLAWRLLALLLAYLARKNALTLARKWAAAVFALVSIGLPPEAKSRWRAEAMMDIEEDIWDLMKDSRESNADVAVHVFRRTLDLLWAGWGERETYARMRGLPDNGAQTPKGPSSTPPWPMFEERALPFLGAAGLAMWVLLPLSLFLLSAAGQRLVTRVSAGNSTVAALACFTLYTIAGLGVVAFGVWWFSRPPRPAPAARISH